MKVMTPAEIGQATDALYREMVEAQGNLEMITYQDAWLMRLAGLVRDLAFQLEGWGVDTTTTKDSLGRTIRAGDRGGMLTRATTNNPSEGPVWETKLAGRKEPE